MKSSTGSLLEACLLCSLATLTQPFSTSTQHITSTHDGIDSRSTLTSAVLEISYDGTCFHGWSAANDGAMTKNTFDKAHGMNEPYRKRRSRRNRNRPPSSRGVVRSVEGAISFVLARLYGSVPQSCIQVEGCSRTDRGVHARQMIAQIYCLKNSSDEDSAPLSIPGKSIGHPISPSDSNFKPLPFDSDLTKLTFTLNKMLPPDVRVIGASPTPVLTGFSQNRPFHPSLDAMKKTYQYTFSVGELHDPIRRRHVWHTQCKSFDMEKANDLCEIFCGTHDFKSFRGSFRGNERGRQQDTVCTIESISISKVFDDRNTLPSCETYCISFTGNRFLYKMVRFLVGTIIDFGTGRKGITIDQISQTLCATIRENTETTSNRITTCAPSTGLVLHKVEYPPDWNFKWVRERV